MLRKRTTQEDEKRDEDETIPTRTETKKRSSGILLKIALVVLLVVYVAIPLLVYYSPSVRRHAVFLHYVSLSRPRNLSLPEESGLKCTRNFYIKSAGGLRLGAWHVPPASALPKCRNGEVSADEEFRDDRPVFLYLHGNAGNREGSHRVELYKVLSEKVDAHVIAFDYRGFGDSTNTPPTERGVVEDTQHVYDWILEQRVNPSRVFVWGHSLGTGVGVAFLHQLKSRFPAALILEAPFTRVIDAAKHHPLSIIHRYMPFFETLIAGPIGDQDTGFDSLGRIGQVKCPILILHAEDDGFVPFDHGRQLYEVAAKQRQNVLHPHATQFVAFEAKFDFGHKYIYKNPELPKIVKQFMAKIQPKMDRA